MRSGSFFVLRTSPDPLAMYLSHRGPLFHIRIQPVQYQRFDYPFGVCQVLRAIIFKGSERLAVEAIRPLDRLGMGFRFRRATS
jgi:hypothetical protein